MGEIMSRLLKLRKEMGITQQRVAILTGIDQSDYSKLETGKRNMSFEQCKILAVLFKTSMDYLAGLTDQQKPYPRKY
jgi:hypothetical protein